MKSLKDFMQNLSKQGRIDNLKSKAPVSTQVVFCKTVYFYFVILRGQNFYSLCVLNTRADWIYSTSARLFVSCINNKQNRKKILSKQFNNRKASIRSRIDANTNWAYGQPSPAVCPLSLSNWRVKTLSPTFATCPPLIIRHGFSFC